MKILHLQDIEKVENSSPLFTAPVTMQTVVSEKESEHNIIYVHFPQGVRNKFHKHNNDQILIVTEGHGIVATDNKEQVIAIGDVVIVPADEKHWHGASQDSAMTHISITLPQTSIEQIEE